MNILTKIYRLASLDPAAVNCAIISIFVYRILMVFFRENYRRLDIDMYGKSKKYTGIQEEVHAGHDYIIKE